ncbi:unnamed protein product [Ambrosiozyma monospora]|uniref:Unnamed protein product n=1 Tax=Ambrosiozyma monospora TaxID=43982 RepID=A0A9W6YSN4_AMBMO|nr:unnamed protein product [Ambrosiozyma monospora]
MTSLLELEHIISDKGPQFANTILRNLTYSLGVTHNTSVTAHHQSNGKAERYIKIFEDYLRCFITTGQDWIKLVPLAEYVINSTPSLAIAGKSPYEIDIGFVPPSPYSLIYGICEEGRGSEEIWTLLEKYGKIAQDALESAFRRNKRYYNVSRINQTLKPGDEVFIDTKVSPKGANLEVVRSLRGKYSGPYKVLKQLSPVNYELELPPSAKVDPIFHISQLKVKQAIPEGYFTVLRMIRLLKV